MFCFALCRNMCPFTIVILNGVPTEKSVGLQKECQNVFF